eukprot:TRINITY_DN3276_c0_g1_i1.p1 TRINITY_DN3276_c0_g1~~TRINITY_DN3276_c0_g1_i1.p1  ORF type:complete len:426 (+),score=139.33 TRINITY_DN3276_c0_g1_i1:63-1340(+)
MSTPLADEGPILCGTCLGDNPFIRMTKEPYGKACKICERPFTVYRWKPGKSARFKKTEICPTCAKVKNVCQTCILDLQFGLPVQVRDTALDDSQKVDLPKDETNRHYFLENLEKKADLADPTSSYGKVENPSQSLSKLARKQPYYARNLPHLCSFYARGACSRGASCPYRHEMPITGEMANQNIKDRYWGQNDPVARKLLGKSRTPSGGTASGSSSGSGGSFSSALLTPPEDMSITTLWVGNLDSKTSDLDIRDKFATFGDITNIFIVSAKNCAFVTFAERSAAEEAARKLHNHLEILTNQCKIAWGKKKEDKTKSLSSSSSSSLSSSSSSSLSSSSLSSSSAPSSSSSLSSSSSSATTTATASNTLSLRSIPPPPPPRALLPSPSAISSSLPSSSSNSSLPAPPGMKKMLYPSQNPNQFSTKFI